MQSDEALNVNQTWSKNYDGKNYDGLMHPYRIIAV